MFQFPLPMAVRARTEFGFARTECACPACVAYCRFLPGYLVPSDLDRIRAAVGGGAKLMDWAERYLRASPGAIVRTGPRIHRIRTLVPARDLSGSCVFLTADHRCGIHPVAPFGCAFLDPHLPSAEGDARSRRGLHALAGAWARGELYAQVWAGLDALGLRAVPPEVARDRMRNAGGPPPDPPRRP